MKKLLGILVLGLLWCNISFADAVEAKQTCEELGFEPGSEKFADCALQIMTMDNAESDNQTDVTSTSTQDQQYDSTAEFVNVEKNKWYYKYKKKYMRTPESVLCISYINKYGWHKREKKQAIKFEVLEARGINCDPYMEVAYYDKEKRDKEFRDAAKETFDAGVSATYGVSGSDTNTKRTRRNCIVQKVGKNLYKQTCR